MRYLKVILGITMAVSTSSVLAGTIDCGKDDPAAAMVRKELGRLTVKDDVNQVEYQFTVCEERNTAKEELTLRIKSSDVTGTYWDQKIADKLAAAMSKKGEACQERGGPYTPKGKNDHRRIQYLLCQESGKPAKVEIRMTALKSDSTPQDEKILSVTWPK